MSSGNATRCHRGRSRNERRETHRIWRFLATHPGSSTHAGAVNVERPAALFAGVEPLEVFVDLLADIDTRTSSPEFYDRICEAIFMADPGRRRVRAVGAHGASLAQLAPLRPTLVNTPIAQRALLEDEVIV